MGLIERVLVRAFLMLFNFWNGVSVVGMERIPGDGQFIVASNHISYLDPVIILAYLHKRRPMAPIATKGLFRFPLTVALRSTDAVPVDRGSVRQRRFLNEALKGLEKRPLLIFPEGGIKRYKKGEKVPGGTGYIALKAQLPVIPLRIEGTDRAMPAGSYRLRRAPISLTIGDPISVRDKSRSYSDIAKDIMARIYSL